jgi:hypothetical protein
MGRSRRQRNCNTPSTCQVDSVGALDLLAGQTAQCEPQVLESNPPALICDTPVGIQSLQGSNDQPIILSQLSELADAGQAIVIKEPSGRIRCLVAPNGVDFGVPVYQAGAVSVKDLAFALQNFNVSSIGTIGQCNFSLAVWSRCNDGSSIISLKQMSFEDFVIAMGNALLADSDFISKLDETVLSCTNTSQQTSLTSLFGCFNGAKAQMLTGSGPRELAGYNGVWNVAPRGLTLKINFVQLFTASNAQNVTSIMPGYPSTLPNGLVWAVFQTITTFATHGGKVDVQTNGVRIAHVEAPSDSGEADYAFSFAPASPSQIFALSTPNSTSFTVTVNLIGYFS